MGKLSIGDIVVALSGIGIRTERGFPARKLPGITEPVAAVSLQEASMGDQTLTALVRLYTPANYGGPSCEEAALAVGEVLTELGGECTVSKCQFDGHTGLFCSDITVRILTAVPKVAINSTELPYVEAFTCWRTTDDEVTDINDAKWQFRLEEFFPAGTDREEELTDPFTLIHVGSSGSDTYLNCCWTYQRRVWSSAGIRQIRLGAAAAVVYG